jgi:hypothetical protein
MSDRLRTPPCSDMLYCHCAVTHTPIGWRLIVLGKLISPYCAGKTYFVCKNRIKSRTSWHLVSTCLAVAHLLIFFIPYYMLPLL